MKNDWLKPLKIHSIYLKKGQQSNTIKITLNGSLGLENNTLLFICLNGDKKKEKLRDLYMCYLKKKSRCSQKRDKIHSFQFRNLVGFEQSDNISQECKRAKTEPRAINLKFFS